MEWILALVALALLGVATISRLLPGKPLTPAMLFVGFGLLVGPKLLDGIDLASTGSVRAPTRRGHTRPRPVLGRLAHRPGRASPVDGCAAPAARHRPAADDLLGAVAAAAVFGQLTIEEALILAIVLAPTDAALGQAVVTEPRVHTGSARG